MATLEFKTDTTPNRPDINVTASSGVLINFEIHSPLCPHVTITGETTDNKYCFIVRSGAWEDCNYVGSSDEQTIKTVQEIMNASSTALWPLIKERLASTITSAAAKRDLVSISIRQPTAN